MFSWSIAKSAEAVFTRWAVKRLFKFLLKKKLGKFILGEIDLDQLDVQLGHGTIQLTDVALNVDYLNTKLAGVASLIIKEGSVGALSVRMPWRGKGFEVGVDELELVLSLGSKRNLFSGDVGGGGNNSSFSEESERRPCGELGRVKENASVKSSSAAAGDVHEGVKTIAKMVKWFLTSFHVKVKKLIVAFEPYLEKDGKMDECEKTLVLRILETECGTCVSDDADSGSDDGAKSFLGISRLTNFVKFQGAVLELLRMDDVDNQTCSACALGLSFTEVFSGQYLPSATPVVTGEKSGFSGNLKLSIPWKNDSLDVSKVDTDVFIDPVELRLQPSTIKWFIHSWEVYKNMDKDGRCNMLYKSTDSVYFNSASHFHSSTPINASVPTDKMVPGLGSFSSTCSSMTGHKSVSEVVLPGSHFIPNWVPNSVEENDKDHTQEELDLGASVDQFFDCLDGLRNSQSTLRSSGMWNWTCSVLSAASSLASGSVYIPSEQQHAQTNLKATLAGISIMLSFQDEDQEHLYDPKGCFGSNVHYLGAECREIFVSLQLCPQDMRFDGTVKYIEVADYTCNENMNQEYSNYTNCRTLLIQRVQDEVQKSLPLFALSTKDPHTEDLSTHVVAGFPFGNLTKIKLLSTLGTTYCLFTVNSDSLDGSLTGSTSFSLQLPPFVLWVNFWSINAVLDLLKDVTRSVELKSQRNGLLAACGEHGPSSGEMAKGLLSGGKTLSSKENLRGNISIPSARVILCFPFGSVKDIGGYSPWEEFICIDFSTPSTLGKGKVEATNSISDAGSPRRCTSRQTCVLHLNLGNVNIYMVCPTRENDVGLNSSSGPRKKFCAQNVFSVSNKAGHLSTVSMVWQEGPVTGPWIPERAKSLATSEDSGSRKRCTVKGDEFVAVSFVEDIEDVNSPAREEIILSSSLFLHVHLFPVTIDLGSSQYSTLHRLLGVMINELSGIMCSAFSAVELSSVSQTSILVECEFLEILISPDVKEEMKSSLQNELPGSWHFFKLRLVKFNMLSVSNIGGIKAANFFWLAHGEGKLWGSITGVLDQEFLLISCSNSTRKRGDGAGSNVLSTRLAGSNIVHLWGPICFHNFTSITLSCDTIIAVGGRLDWLNVISSFFIFPSPEFEKAGADNLPKEDLKAASKSSFILKLVDVGLSYEPYLKNSVVMNLPSESTSSPFKGEVDEPCVACLLAASSLTLSNTAMEDSTNSDFKIRMQDLGLLICAAGENMGSTYSVEHLQEMGYVKVAQEALVEAILRTNCENGLLWEVECSKSHIFMETCHDTTSGLMGLSAQLQQLFAPDLEESVVHLQKRWNNVHQAQERDEFIHESSNSIHHSILPTAEVHVACLDTTNKVGVFGLMDEISEDAFHLDRNQVNQFDANESQFHVSLDENLLRDPCYPSMETPDPFSDAISFDGSVPREGLETSQTSFLQNGSFPEFIEGYCLSDLRPLSELAISRQPPPEILKLKSGSFGGGIGRGNSGWYGDASLSIVENHIPGTSDEAIVNKFLEDKLPSVDSPKSVDFGKAIGRLLFKNSNIIWRMYNGSDWHSYSTNYEPPSNNCGRDKTACLELALSGIQFQYDFFPTGGICASKLNLSVQDFYLYDKSQTAPWKRVLGYYNSKDHPRESSSKAFKLDLEAVRPDPLIPLEEYRLHIAVLPMLLHLHQSQLDFLISFFGPRTSSSDPSLDCQTSVGAKPSAMKCCNIAGHTLVDEALLPYFQKFDIWPLLVRVDYSPNHVDLTALRSGKYVELVNLVPWKGVELQLKHVHAVGVYGWGTVCETIIGEWLEEVSQNQMHKILQGLPTIRSLVAVGAGAAKLVSLPVESYRKEQRILKGMQRGTIAFLRSISLEAVGLGVHLAAGAHEILLQAEYILTSISPSVSRPVHDKTKPNVRCNQPKDAQQGIQQACESLSDGLGKSASALVRVPLKKYQRGATAGSALATAVRAVPAAAIAPVSACASAAHYTLLGIRNSLDPQRKKESVEKYLGPPQQHDSN